MVLMGFDKFSKNARPSIELFKALWSIQGVKKNKFRCEAVVNVIHSW